MPLGGARLAMHCDGDRRERRARRHGRLAMTGGGGGDQFAPAVRIERGFRRRP
jgi:hypothetical protein